MTTYAQVDRSKRPEPGPAPEVKLGNTESFTLPNSLKVFVVENHKLPVITASIQLDIYPELEGQMAGYTEFLSELLTAGTKSRSKDQLNKEIDYIGARISASSRGMYGQSLKKHQEKLLALMGDIAMNADFKEEELEKVRTRMMSNLQTELNEPDAMLNNVTSVINYGPNHPYGEVPNENTVRAVTLEKCREYYNTYYRPNVAYMAVVGDVTAKEIKPLIEQYFGKWEKKDVPVTKYDDPKPPKATHVAMVKRDESVQSVINVTYPIELEPGDPDVIKAKVANATLGGGSMGRLFMNLRETHAWTYGSYSSISQDELIGAFTAYAKCRNAVTDSSVAEILTEMERMRDEKVSEEDLKDQITYMSGNFAIGLERPQTVAQYAINIERFNMPKDYYSNYLKNLNAVTAADVQTVSRKYIRPEAANIIVVGSSDVRESLKRFDSDGKIDIYDNYGSRMVELSMPLAQVDITADEVIKAYVRAIGGEETIKSIKDIKTVSKGAVSVAGQEIPLTITEMKERPYKLSMIVKGSMQGQEMTFNKQVFDGTDGYVEQAGQRVELKPEDVADMKAQADMCPYLNAEEYGIERKVLGIEKVNGSDAYKVEAKQGDSKTIEFFDKETGYLVKSQSAVEGTVLFSNYKDVGMGYFIPYNVELSQGGQVITAEVESVEVNKGIDDTNFQ